MDHLTHGSEISTGSPDYSTSSCDIPGMEKLHNLHPLENGETFGLNLCVIYLAGDLRQGHIHPGAITIPALNLRQFTAAADGRRDKFRRNFVLPGYKVDYIGDLSLSSESKHRSGPMFVPVVF